MSSFLPDLPKFYPPPNPHRPKFSLIAPISANSACPQMHQGRQSVSKPLSSIGLRCDANISEGLKPPFPAPFPKISPQRSHTPKNPQIFPYFTRNNPYNPHHIRHNNVKCPYAKVTLMPLDTGLLTAAGKVSPGWHNF